jgi:hypothetical protein
VLRSVLRNLGPGVSEHAPGPSLSRADCVGLPSRAREEPRPIPALNPPLPSVRLATPRSAIAPVAHAATHELMTRVSLLALTLIVAACIYAVIAGPWRTSHESRPPSLDTPAAWEWVAAEPGANLYVSREGSGAPQQSLPSAWINRERSPGPASVGGSVLELRQFDCQRRTSRLRSLAHVYRDVNGAEQLEMTPESSGWSSVTPATSAEQVLYLICGSRAQRAPTIPSRPGITDRAGIVR